MASNEPTSRAGTNTEHASAGHASGYVTDIPYTYGFYPRLAPAWLDFAAVISGTTPPTRRDGFAWCEIGCGQGMTTAILAATHPGGRFVGIDLMPDHIDHASRFARAADIGNVTFLAADVADDLKGGEKFDYIVAHGLYSWIDGAAQAAVRRFIDRHLSPGGLVHLSYNAMPGWAADLPFQRLALALGRDQAGDSTVRFQAALTTIRAMMDAGAPSLGGGTMAAQIIETEARFPRAYLAHEYMGSHWQPLFVTEVRSAMAEIGLVPAGSATLAENFDSFVLRRAERAVLEAFDDGDPDLRELVRDYLVHQRFRRDVYCRGSVDLDDDERRDRLVATRYALVRPAELVEYQARFSRGGELAFDNDTARGIVAALAGGPRRLADLPGMERQDLVASALALCCAGAVRPVEAGDASADAVNRTIGERLGGPEQINHVALSCGTAVSVKADVLRAFCGGDAAPGDTATAAWLRYLTVHTGRA
jgi:SAM-dependent methyltransferase